MNTTSYLAHRILPDGRLVGVVPLLFGRSRLVITHRGDPDGLEYADVWDYEHPTRAIAEMLRWDPATGEPEHWNRHPRTGRYRPTGSPDSGEPPASITCPHCGMTSHHPGDIEHRYCGNCHRFHGQG